MTLYYKISGMNEGKPIKDYIISTDIDDLDYHLKCFGDQVRYYEPASKEEYLRALGIILGFKS